MAKEDVTTLDALTLDGRNFNRHTEQGMNLLEKSLRELGAGRSILVDKDNNIIAGNGIVEAAGKAGITRVRMVEVQGDELVAVKRTDMSLDSREGRQMALADNATAAADLSWDTDTLQEVADEFDIDTEEWGVELEPFETLGGSDGDAHDDGFDENTVTKNICQRGDLWQLGEHRLICGDSTSDECLERLMGGEKADMCFTDPPYGVSIGDKNALLNSVNGGKSIEQNIEYDTLPAEELRQILVKAMTNARLSCKDDASYFVTSPQGGELCMMMMMMQDAGLKVRHVLIWCKNTATFSLGRLDYDYQHEPIFYTWTKSHHNYREGEFRTSIWKYDKPRKCDLHPTMKPVELVANCLKDCTRKGDLVIDVFGGSGTTIVAAEQLGRRCYMVELDPHYCDVIITRWETLTGKKAVKINAATKG